MNGQQIIDQFRVETDGQDELSDAEVLQLANDVIQDIFDDRDWEFLKKTETGTLDTTNTEYTLPTDFRELSKNITNEGEPVNTVLYVDTTFEPYTFITQAERRDYRDLHGYAYIDHRQQKLVLTKLESIDSRIYEFDYIFIPDDITVSTSPVIPARFHKIIPFGMAVKWNDIDGTDKSFSYRGENAFKFESGLNTLRQQDAKHKNVNL